MKAAWYESQGPARDVLVVGEMDDAVPGPGEVLIRVAVSGVNPGDVKKREGWLGSSMPYPRVIPHSDAGGEIVDVGEGVDRARVGERVWCHGAQSYRPCGTAAELVAVPERQALPLPDGVSFDTGACLGIPGITAHRAVFGDGPVDGRVVLVAGAAGAVGSAALELAAFGGARVLATVRAERDVASARQLGADDVFVLADSTADAIRAAAPDGVERIVEVALDANAELDAAIVAQGAVIAAYATRDPEPRLPFWPLLFQNVTLRLLGSDDFSATAKEHAARDLTDAVAAGRLVPEVALRVPLDRIVDAHEAVEHPKGRGRVLVDVGLVAADPAADYTF